MRRSCERKNNGGRQKSFSHTERFPEKPQKGPLNTIHYKVMPWGKRDVKVSLPAILNVLDSQGPLLNLQVRKDRNGAYR